MSIYPERVY